MSGDDPRMPPYRPGTGVPGNRVLVKRSLVLSGHRTSVALEPEFWVALEDMARARAVALPALIGGIDATRDPARPLASALRVAALHEAWKRGAAGDGAASDERASDERGGDLG
jgi:predicted DNA-binding ribbon-helix-helix protein